MSIAAIVPARGGSKSIPYKNIIDVNGKPLIFYVLTALLKSNVDNVFVSTEDNIIKKTVKDLFSNDVIILDRPIHLAEDDTTSEAVVKDFLSGFLKSYEYTMLAQCTSPLTITEDFNRLIELVSYNDSAAFYVECYDYFFDIEKDFDKINKERLPRQIKKPRKKEAGNAWIFNSRGFLYNVSRLFGKIGLCKIPLLRSLEIDDYEDLELIRAIINYGDKR